MNCSGFGKINSVRGKKEKEKERKTSHIMPKLLDQTFWPHFSDQPMSAMSEPTGIFNTKILVSSYFHFTCQYYVPSAVCSQFHALHYILDLDTCYFSFHLHTVTSFVLFFLAWYTPLHPTPSSTSALLSFTHPVVRRTTQSSCMDEWVSIWAQVEVWVGPPACMHGFSSAGQHGCAAGISCKCAELRRNLPEWPKNKQVGRK